MGMRKPLILVVAVAVAGCVAVLETTAMAASPDQRQATYLSAEPARSVGGGHYTTTIAAEVGPVTTPFFAVPVMTVVIGFWGDTVTTPGSDIGRDIGVASVSVSGDGGSLVYAVLKARLSDESGAGIVGEKVTFSSHANALSDVHRLCAAT